MCIYVKLVSTMLHEGVYFFLNQLRKMLIYTLISLLLQRSNIYYDLNREKKRTHTYEN